MSTDGQGSNFRRSVAGNFNVLSRTHERYRQTDARQTDRWQIDGRAIAYNERQVVVVVVEFITRRRSWSFAEYCKYFAARLNDVRAFGYNSAGSERIWMKFGKLRVYGLELSLANFGRDPRRSGFARKSRIFVFCPLNDPRFHRLPVGRISRNLHKKTCFREVCWSFGTFVKICP